jgi:hypothetical protein
MGSFEQFQFEATLLNRTVCDIHVFDPTVLPSRLREREVELNKGLPKPRIWWHSLGIGAADIPAGSRCTAVLPCSELCGLGIGCHAWQCQYLESAARACSPMLTLPEAL